MAVSVTELGEHFQTKLTNLKNAIALFSAKGEPGCRALMNNIDSDLREMHLLLTLMKTDLSQRKEALRNVEELKTKTSQLQQRVVYADNNLPARLPKFNPSQPELNKTKANKSQRGGRTISTSSAELHKETKPSKKSVRSSSASRDNLAPKKKERRPSAAEHASSRKGDRRPSTAENRRPSTTETHSSKLAAIPTIEYVTVDEFSAIPKYMKGRVNYDMMNTAIDQINKTIQFKYQVLMTPKSGLNDLLRRRIKDYKEMENKETKGAHFVVDSDLQENSNFKLDASGRCILTMLRHCGRLREIRGNGLLRYAICTNTY